MPWTNGIKAEIWSASKTEEINAKTAGRIKNDGLQFARAKSCLSKIMLEETFKI